MTAEAAAGEKGRCIIRESNEQRQEYPVPAVFEASEADEVTYQPAVIQDGNGSPESGQPVVRTGGLPFQEKGLF